MNREKMAEFLVQLRKERNLLQQDVAELFAVTPQAVCKWEKGESVPDIEILQKLSEFYEVSLEEILEGERKRNIELNKKKEESKIKHTPIIISSIFLILFLLSCVLEYVEVLTVPSSSYKFSLFGIILLTNANLTYFAFLLAISAFIGGCLIDIIHTLRNDDSTLLPFIRNLMVSYSSLFLISYVIYYGLYQELFCSPSLFTIAVVLTYFILLLSVKTYRKQNCLMPACWKRTIFNTSFLSLILPTIFVSDIDAITFVYFDLIMMVLLSCTYFISFFTKKRMKVIYVIENSLFIVFFILKSFQEIGRVASIYILIILTINLVLSLTLKFFRKPKNN